MTRFLQPFRLTRQIALRPIARLPSMTRGYPSRSEMNENEGNVRPPNIPKHPPNFAKHLFHSSDCRVCDSRGRSVNRRRRNIWQGRTNLTRQSNMHLVGTKCWLLKVKPR